MVLVERREDGGDLPLAERVVERLVDRLRQDPHAGRGVPIDDDRGLEPPVLLIGGDVAQLVQPAQPAEHPRRERVQLGEIGALQRVLVLGAGRTPPDAEVLDDL